MKKLLLMVGMISSGSLLFAQQTAENNEVITTNSLGQTVITCQPLSFMVTPPMSEWADVDPNAIANPKEARNNFEREGYLEAQLDVVQDPVLQDEFGTMMNRAPIINFAGMSGSGYPPDPSGAAGPNHYVQAVNTSYRVYSKTGSPMTTIKSLSTLWPGSTNEGDPIVLYDKHADRWFISQFQFSPNRILVAISQTNDPTGAYYAYSFTLSQFPDYPKYSIWWDGYYMTSNSTHTAVVFERDKMLAGDPAAQMVSLSLPSLNNGGFRSPLSADADGDLPPNGTPCYFFNLEDNAFSGVSQDQIEIYEMTTNWANTSASQVVSSQQLPVPSFDAVFTGGFANISQPGTSQKLDAIQGVLMFRAQHMRWVGYNTIVLTHAVDLGSNRSGVRWYELRDANNGTWSVYQSGTYAPDNANRWMSSAAMDNFGNIGLAYSFDDPANTIYPGIRYTGRLATDALGQMTFTEEEAIAGVGSQSGIDRYGDYAHMSLDPDGSTFWYTGEYLGSGGSPKTRIFSFKLVNNAGLENPLYDGLNLTVATSATEISMKADGIKVEGAIQLDLIGMDGRVIASTEKVVNAGEVDHIFSTAGLKAGIYFVRIGNEQFQKVQRIYFNN